MNPLDRVIGWISPERGLRRVMSRSMLDRYAKQSYDGATMGRRTDGWTTGLGSANTEIQGALPRLMSRSRDLCRNDVHMISAKRAVREYSVGTGIELQLEDPKWQALWDAWVKQADADGMLSFYGIQALAAATIFESGAVLIRRRPRRAEDGLAVPLQLQLMEPDFLDAMRDNVRDGGGWIQHGIEFDALGRRLGYWMYPVHPGENGYAIMRRGISAESRFVPASEIVHAFVVERPGQISGVPWTSGVIVKTRDLSDYEDAELMRKKIEACNVGAVTQAGGIWGNPLGPRPGTAPSSAGANGSPRPEQFEPGTFNYFGPGESVVFNDPKGNTAYPSYVKTQKESIGAGVGVPYAKLTGDLTQANYSSLKAGGTQFEQSMDVLRWITLVPRVCETVLQWFFEAAELGRVAPGKRPAYEWQAPPYPEVDPHKEASARVIDIRAGVKSPQEVLRSRGVDPRRQIEQFKEWNAQLDAAGVVLDTDPRKVTQSGLTQSTNDTDPNPEREDDEE